MSRCLINNREYVMSRLDRREQERPHLNPATYRDNNTRASTLKMHVHRQHIISYCFLIY
jgi:hypothetical protein